MSVYEPEFRVRVAARRGEGNEKGRTALNCTPKVGHNFWGVL
jgi:hypothetical protein